MHLKASGDNFGWWKRGLGLTCCPEERAMGKKQAAQLKESGYSLPVLLCLGAG